jgi:hypothetical protein
VTTAVKTTLITVCFAALALAPSADATFPGGNGKIVYVAGGNLATINPDGTGQAGLTSTATLIIPPGRGPARKSLSTARSAATRTSG